MSTQVPIVDPEVKNDLVSATTRIDTAECLVVSVSPVAAFPAALLLLVGLAHSIYTFIIDTTMSDVEEPDGITRIIIGTLLLLLALILMTSLTVISPGQTSMHQSFRKYIGTIRCTGLIPVPPLADNKRIFIEIRNFETNELEANGSGSNPVNIAAIVVWQAADTTHAILAIEEY